MTLARRELLTRTGLAIAASAIASSGSPAGAVARNVAAPTPALSHFEDWGAVGAQFALSPDYIHMSAMLLSSHPRPVRDAIDEYRRGIDADPVTYLQQNNHHLQEAARAAAGQYLGISGSDIALTDSTTMGVALVYNGLRLTPDHEILTTEQDFYVTHEGVRLVSMRTGAKVRKISLYEQINGIPEEQIVDRIAQAITPATRVLALTWVHSGTGLKLPLRRIADALDRINADRNAADRVLFCADGVHGFGIENVTLADLGCDFLMAGCHKWLFGPRGTGIVAGTKRGWDAVLPTIPSFIDGGTWEAWFTGTEPAGPTTGSRMTPGGYKAFEHQWALPQAFSFHQSIGKARVAERTHELSRQLKEGLAGMRHVTLHTPRSDRLSAGIVSFDVHGMSPSAAVMRLRERRIIASVAPYAVPHVRLTPCIANTPGEIDAVLQEVRGLAA